MTRDGDFSACLGLGDQRGEVGLASARVTVLFMPDTFVIAIPASTSFRYEILYW
jgi:hypothetical protein